MGDISIIARRRKDGNVEYGWSGNGGYLKWTGSRLFWWYPNPDDVEYLFSLGQTALIGKKGSEYGGFGRFETHDPIGEEFWIGTTERIIFSKIAFVDYGYFYDWDNEWYYVKPGPFRIKMPLELVGNNVDEQNYEVDFLKEVENKILDYIFHEYKDSDPVFAEYLEKENYSSSEIMKNIEDIQGPSLYELFDKYRGIYDYFDDWILIRANEDKTQITEIVMKKKGKKHIETIEW